MSFSTPRQGRHHPGEVEKKAKENRKRWQASPNRGRAKTREVTYRRGLLNHNSEHIHDTFNRIAVFGSRCAASKQLYPSKLTDELQNLTDAVRNAVFFPARFTGWITCLKSRPLTRDRTCSYAYVTREQIEPRRRVNLCKVGKEKAYPR